MQKQTFNRAEEEGITVAKDYTKWWIATGGPPWPRWHSPNGTEDKVIRTLKVIDVCGGIKGCIVLVR